MPPRDSNAVDRAPGRLFSAVIVALAILILLRALPLARAYVGKLLSLHSAPAVAIAGLAAAGAYLALAAGIARRPRATAALAAAFALLLVVLSGNSLAALTAAGILAGTFLVGDGVSRLLRGREAGPGDLSSVFAAGIVTLGIAALALGELGMWRWDFLLAAAALLLFLRRRRLSDLAGLLRRAVTLPSAGGRPLLDAAWLAAVVLCLAAAWAGALGPDFSWDGLTYHLPEAREAALQGSVEPLVGLEPQTFFWRNEENYLSLAFLFGDERAARLLHFFVGLGAFAATLALLRKLGVSGAASLSLLALAAFPLAILQLHAMYVDWPAAFLVAAAAAEIASSREEPRRVLLASFLFGGAIATKVFALLAAPALLLLLLRRGGWRANRLAAAAAGALLALLPWMLWSQSRAGFFIAPFRSFSSLTSSFSGGKFISHRAPGIPLHVPSVAGFLRLPYDLTFHSHRFERNGDGYDGMLPLLLVPGVAGLGFGHLALFLAASLPVLIPWFRLYEPSVRYLMPLYPLYAVFAASGLARATARFAGKSGLAAGLALTATALAFPVQFGSTGVEWKVAAGRISREEALAQRIPSYPLWKRVRPEDTVLFMGEYDRFHCPARRIFRRDYFPVNRWGHDLALWRSGLRRLHITHIVEFPTPHPGDLFDSLTDTVRLVARNGDASLYRVLPAAAR